MGAAVQLDDEEPVAGARVPRQRGRGVGFAVPSGGCQRAPVGGTGGEPAARAALHRGRRLLGPLPHARYATP